MPKACLFSRSSGHGCSFPVHCHWKIHHCKSEALTIYFCIESSSKGGTKQWTSSIQSPGLSNNRKKKMQLKTEAGTESTDWRVTRNLPRARVHGEHSLESLLLLRHALDRHSKFAWDFFFSLSLLTKTQRKLIWILLNLRKQIYLTASLVKQSLKRDVCFKVK